MRYPDTFTQSIEPDAFDTLPKFCTYEGDAPDLAHLRGLLIPTRDVERLVYVGEREFIWVDDPNRGHGLPARWTPWKGVALTERDANGNVIVDGYVNAPPIPTFSDRAMSTAELAEMGMTDAALDRLSREHLGEPWEPDRPGLSDKRRDVFDRVMAALYG